MIYVCLFMQIITDKFAPQTTIMPLLLITGYPASGKSTIANRISNYFKEFGFEGEIEIITEENDLNFTRSIYEDFKKEKEVRSILRSAVQRILLNKKTLVICDSLNHIKGYRYELYTLAKNYETRYAVLSCNFPITVCKWLNSQRTEKLRYSDTVFTEILNRYEHPNAENRWDSPLFEINITADASAFKEDCSQCLEFENKSDNNTQTSGSVDNYCLDENKLPRNILLPLEHLYCCLIEGKELTANKCMKFNIPIVSHCTSINEIETRIQEITSKLVHLQQTAVPGDNMVIFSGNKSHTIKFLRHRSLPQLTRIRQQFVLYLRTHPQDINAVGALFVDYLNSNP